MQPTLAAHDITSSSPLAVGVYPTDWSLFDTGNPVPGDPFQWHAIALMWVDKAYALDGAIAGFAAGGLLGGQGYKIRYLNESLEVGSSFLAYIRSEFLRVSSLAQQWAGKLADMQTRAKRAHQTAEEAHEQITQLSAKISVLSADLPGIIKDSERDSTQDAIDSFTFQVADAQQVLEQQRQLVRDLAAEYRAVAAATRGGIRFTRCR